jgi:hypothetical protein
MGGDPDALTSNIKALVKSCAQDLSWSDVKTIAEKIEANESTEWSQHSIEIVDVEEKELSMTDVTTHLRLIFPNRAGFSFSIELLCVTLADIGVRDEGMSFPCLYTHLVAEANSVYSYDRDYLIDHIKSNWSTLERIAEKNAADAADSRDCQAYLDDDDFKANFVVRYVDSANVPGISMDNIASLRAKVFDAVWS